MPRYALYFSPAPGSPWWEAGCSWLGRDPARMMECPQPAIPGLPGDKMRALTATARRYGFHATLKAPFRLAPGFSEAHLALMAAAFCATQKPILLEDIQVCSLGDFLALRPAAQEDQINALAMRCVSYFDILRAPPDADELARRHYAGLSERQAALLQRWGYPYVDDEFRFHMTLTDSLAGLEPELCNTVCRAASQHFSPSRHIEPLSVDALCLFREDVPGGPFSLWRRIPFSGAAQTPALPTPGRLFFFVGPSGVGKDTLLQWVRRQMPPEANIVFATRTITRPAHASEVHEAIDEASFQQEATLGRFAMTWQANGLSYGVRRGIEAELRAGRDVIINGSREFVPRFTQQFPDATVIWVHAEHAQLRQRIEARQREFGAAVLERMRRSMQFEAPRAPNVICLDNSGPLEVAGRQLLDILGKRGN